MKIAVTTLFGLESCVRDDLTEHGFDKESITVSDGLVTVATTDASFASDVARTNMWVRRGERVLLEIADFDAKEFDEFYETEFYVREVPAGLGGSNWDEILDRYEALADDYIRLYKMSLSGNITAATEMVSVLSDYESLSEEIEKARGTMTTAQANRFANIQRRMLNAIQ